MPRVVVVGGGGGGFSEDRDQLKLELINCSKFFLIFNFVKVLTEAKHS